MIGHERNETDDAGASPAVFRRARRRLCSNRVGTTSVTSDVLRRFQYIRLKRPGKGMVLRYLERTTGYSRQQLTRLIAQFRVARQLKKRYRPPQAGFTRTYTEADVRFWSRPMACTAPCPAGHPCPDAAGLRGVCRCSLRALGGCSR